MRVCLSKNKDKRFSSACEILIIKKIMLVYNVLNVVI